MPMPDSPTPWYKFRLPSVDDPMSNPQIDITDSFQKIIKASKADIIPDGSALPQTGYNVGDRIYVGGATQSIFICIAVDSLWGTWWKPIQASMSPWVSVPATAFTHPDYQQHPTSPFQITVDNRARLYCRGAIQLKPEVLVIPTATTQVIFAPLPDGIRPPSDVMAPCVIDPVVMTNPPGTAALKSGRVIIRANGTNSHRFYNASAAAAGTKTTDIWHGELKYVTGRDDWVAV